MIQGDFIIDEDGYFILNDKAILNLYFEGEIIGLDMKRGPYSPMVSVIIDEKDMKKISIWDPWCYYERKTIDFLTKKVLKSIKIQISDDEIDYSKSRKDFNFAGIKKLLKLKEFYILSEKELRLKREDLIEIENLEAIKNEKFLLEAEYCDAYK